MVIFKTLFLDECFWSFDFLFVLGINFVFKNLNKYIIYEILVCQLHLTFVWFDDVRPSGVQNMFAYCFPDSHYLQGLQGWTGRMESFGDERELPASFASGSCRILPTWSLPSGGSSFLQQLNLVPRFSNAHTASFILSHWRRQNLCRRFSSGFDFI